jgi:hypothetical protein
MRALMIVAFGLVGCGGGAKECQCKVESTVLSCNSTTCVGNLTVICDAQGASSAVADNCGAAAPCVPDCKGRDCGDDGCGGSCGSCDGPSLISECGSTGGWGSGEGVVYYDELACVEGSCQYTHSGSWSCEYGCDPQTVECKQCQPDCSGKQCGSDGCGGSCGNCMPGTTHCNAANQCEACTPDCAGKHCGDDGCGGSCGACGKNQGCGTNGFCCVQTGEACDDFVPCCTNHCNSTHACDG